MKYEVKVTERINAGNYEFIEISGAVEFTDEDTSDPATFGRQQLDVLLRSHRGRAQSLVAPDVDSFILTESAMED